jgi:hypothetical protein
MTHRKITPWKILSMLTGAVVSSFLCYLEITREGEASWIMLLVSLVPFAAFAFPFVAEWLLRNFDVSFEDGKWRIKEESRCEGDHIPEARKKEN